MKKALALLLVALMTLGMFSFTAAEEKVFTAAMSASPTSLDEGYSTNAYTRQVSAHVFETLFTFDESSAVIPQLVDTYTVSEDGLVYDMTLRQGITFHNGSTFEADDVVASVARYKTNSTYGGNFDTITCEKTGDYSVRFTLETPAALTSLLAFPQRVIMIPSEIAESHMGIELEDAALIGTGPYKVKEWVRDVRIVIEKFDGYVLDERYEGPTGFGGKREAYYETIEFDNVPEAEARIAGLETGEFDFADYIPAISYDRVNDNEDLDVYKLALGTSIVVEFNHAEGFTMDPNFRKALCYAIDPTEVMLSVASGKTEFFRLDPSLYQPSQYFYTEAGSEGIYNAKDLDKVKELLAAANYNGEEIKFLYTKDYPAHYSCAMSLIEQWQAAGINIVPVLNDWTTELSIAQSLTGWSINQTSLSPRFDPIQVRSMVHSGTLGGYGFSDSVIDEMLDQICAGGTNEERLACWTTLQARIWETLPFLKFGDSLDISAIRSDIKGYSTFYVDRFWTIYED